MANNANTVFVKKVVLEPQTVLLNVMRNCIIEEIYKHLFRHKIKMKKHLDGLFKILYFLEEAN